MRGELYKFIAARSQFLGDILINLLWPRQWWAQRKLNKERVARFNAFTNKHDVVKVNGKWTKKG